MKCFYHSADLDGHCSGAIVKLRFPECEMFGINYGQEFPFDGIIPDEDIYMVDFCLQPFEQMERLNNMCKLYWIDHHGKGSIDEAYKRKFYASGGLLLEVGTAACELTWKYFYKNAYIPLVVYLLGRYDVWKHSEDSRILPFQYGMRQFKDTLPNNQGFWNSLLESDFKCNHIAEDGRIILSYEKSQNAKFCEAYAFETKLKNYSAVCANKGFANSKLFDSIYDPKKYDLMITFVKLKTPSKKWTVSLYSTKEEINCGEIARSFGGGGHKGAAGFQCEELPFAF